VTPLDDAVTHTAEVVVVGSGAAGIYAALEAQRLGADVLLLDKSLIGRGGATVMAQMTVAAALGHEEPDDPSIHLADTLAGAKGIANEELAGLLCEDGPRRILETRDMGVEWAANGDRLIQVAAPGHSRKRCCYVDVLATGASVTRFLRIEVRRRRIRTLTNVIVSDLVTDGDGRVVGAAALDVATGQPVAIWAGAVVLACGGLTELYRRNSASLNMTGDASALALAAGADVVDMEMVQFFPIAGLSPRTVGLDPIMWDPFRYKLGGRLLNGEREEFIHRYAGQADEGRYTATRDVASYAILKEVAAGRGSPHGGAYLDFTDLPAEQIHAAFPPVVDKLLAQGIDLTKQAVEVAPTAHYTIGGVRVGPDMATTVPGLWAAGEAVGGQHGANRLSGNAITETFVFGAAAGVDAARAVRAGEVGGPDDAARRRMAEHLAALDAVPGRAGAEGGDTTPRLKKRLKALMWDDVGPFRDAEGLDRAAAGLADLAAAHAAAPVGPARVWNVEWVEWLELKLMLAAAGAVRAAAAERRESRGAHQREDLPATDPAMEANVVVSLEDGAPVTRWVPVTRRSGSGTPAPAGAGATAASGGGA
jgi:succinate dehydrogenase/fumarate reductase flavoprotein subunit